MSKFKDERTGNWLTQSLFFELSYNNPKFAIYTLKDDDIEVEIEGKKRKLKAIKKLYLSCSDPTEYEFANKYLGGWRHWKRICEKTTLLHPYIEEWREEMEVKMRSEGVKAIANNAAEGNYQAAKFLAEKGWVDKAKGRPSKEKKAREEKVQQEILGRIGSDLERIKLQ